MNYYRVVPSASQAVVGGTAAVFMIVGGLIGMANHYVVQGGILIGAAVICVGWAVFVARRTGGFHGDGFDFKNSEVAVDVGDADGASPGDSSSTDGA